MAEKPGVEEYQYFTMPESECVRLNRSEMQSIRWCLAALNSCIYAKDDLAGRLEMIPDGKERWAAMVEDLRRLVNDLIGTIPVRQCQTIKHTMDDMELRMVPKFTPADRRVSMGVDDLSFFVREAKKSLCVTCFLTGDECRKCEMYRILEAIAPLKEWGDGFLCPYSKEDWWDK